MCTLGSQVILNLDFGVGHRTTAGTWTNPGGKSAERRLRGFKVMPVLCFSTPVRENYFAPQNGTHLINSGTPVSGKRVDHMIRLVGA